MNRTRTTIAFLSLTAALAACTPPAEQAKAPERPKTLAAAEVADLTRKVDAELDDLHAAAAAADEARYFGHFAPEAVFLGTDAKERWDMAAFRAFAHPHFAEGKGWTYKRVRRAVSFAEQGDIAYFDEDLANDRIGPTRGSGVLVRDANGRYLVVQYNLALTIPNERVAAVKNAILNGASADGTAAPKPPDLHARYKVAYDKATEAAAAGDFSKARELLSAIVPEAKTKPDDDLELWLHNQLTWLRWAENNLAGALEEVDAARATLDHATLPFATATKLRLHEKWDRAYVLREMAESEPAAGKAAALARAVAAKADYDSLAAREHDVDGAAVLEAFFALQSKKTKDAATAAKKVDVEKDTDVQDLYVIARALEGSPDKSDKDAAARAQAKICAAKPYLMKPLILAQRKREGHACP
jgi:hypothetical protein